MMQPRSRLQILGAIVVAGAMVWSSGMVASALPQSERLHAAVHSVRVIDYATDVVAPGSRFTTQAAYDH
jgi:hypothetical protein